MATPAHKRKTPCDNCKGAIRLGNAAPAWICWGCGEWKLVNGKAVRP